MKKGGKQEGQDHRERTQAACIPRISGNTPSQGGHVKPGRSSQTEDSSWSPAAGEVNPAIVRRHQENRFSLLREL